MKNKDYWHVLSTINLAAERERRSARQPTVIEAAMELVAHLDTLKPEQLGEINHGLVTVLRQALEAIRKARR